MFTTETTGCWNELETKNFSLEEPRLNTALGEEEKAYVIGYALRRDVKGKEQRVFVLGMPICTVTGNSSKPGVPSLELCCLRMECSVGLFMMNILLMSVVRQPRIMTRT